MNPSYVNFIYSVTLSAFESFLFGWHVHEKAVMIILVPLSLISLDSEINMRAYILLTFSGTISLFPLLYKMEESPIKYAIFGMWFLLIPPLLQKQLPQSQKVYAIDKILFIYYGLLSLVLIIPYFIPSYEFISLMAISVYCSVGIITSFCLVLYSYFSFH